MVAIESSVSKRGAVGSLVGEQEVLGYEPRPQILNESKSLYQSLPTLPAASQSKGEVD